MKRTFMLAIFAVVLFSCSHTRPIVEMHTVAGDLVQMIEPQRIGDRADVPVGVNPEHVIGQVKTKDGAIITFVKKPFHEAEIYQNQEAVKEEIKTVLPKRPWYYWPIRVLILIAFLAVVVLIVYLKNLLGPVIGFLKKL